MTTTTASAVGPARRIAVLLTWRYLAEYARRPLNLVLLAVVPVVFVTLSAGASTDKVLSSSFCCLTNSRASSSVDPSGSPRAMRASRSSAGSFIVFASVER